PLVARIFERDLVTGLQQNPRDEIQRLLGPIDDYDLRRVAIDRAGAPQVRADGLPQTCISAGVAIVELRDRNLACALEQQSAPHREGKGREVAASIGKVIRKRGKSSRRNIHL